VKIRFLGGVTSPGIFFKRLDIKKIKILFILNFLRATTLVYLKIWIRRQIMWDPPASQPLLLQQTEAFLQATGAAPLKTTGPFMRMVHQEAPTGAGVSQVATDVTVGSPSVTEEGAEACRAQANPTTPHSILQAEAWPTPKPTGLSSEAAFQVPTVTRTGAVCGPGGGR
jgi:hypothetical protein